MKRIAVVVMAVMGMVISMGALPARAGEIDVLVNKLVEKGIISPADAQIIMDESRMQVSKEVSQGKSLSAPEWTQRIKWGGDVRFRTQGDWAKNNTANSGNNGIENQRIRQRVRGRFWMDGKVNDFTYAGVRFAGGGDSRNSTNDTLGNTTSLTGGLENYFRKAPVMFDQYWIRFEAPSELTRSYGQFFNDAKFWCGRIPIPYYYSELVWDSDINPSGMAFQYESPDLKFGPLPAINAYGNIGIFWLDESQDSNTDPMLYGYQVGLKTEPFGPLASEINVGIAWYDFANMAGKTPNGAGTNSRWQVSEAGPASTLLGKDRYEYNTFDLIMTVDNSKIGDIDFPHGFYMDYIYNPSAPSENKGALLGGYIGKKKPKNPGEWKARLEWRYIERDSIPDFMPDSDFYGFGTYAAGNNQNTNGRPAEGGTNGKGINTAFEYQLLKNTTLNIEYYWMKPIKSWDKQSPWNELQVDCITKF